MRAGPLRDALLPWAGLIGGTLGWALAHQVGSDSVTNNCALGSPLVVWSSGIAGLLIAAGGAWYSWGLASREAEGPARRMIALVSLMAAALFALAIILPLIAALVIPPCYG